jgi:predicted metalloprotease with PDZ domain
MGPDWRLSASSPCVRDRIIVPDVVELPLTMAASGDYRSFTKNVGASEIALAIADTWSFADSELFDVVCRIVSEEISIFGSAPRARYLFICDRNPVLGGSRFDYYGIHYGGSMILLLDRRLDRSELMDTPMAIIAHEFFHNWNGDALGASSNEFLWFTEGVTNYFSYRVLREAYIITDGQYLSRRRAVSERYHANPYAGTMSIGEAGNNDMRDKDMVNLLYDGGFLVAEALETRLRAESGGKVTLIDVLKRMYEQAPGSGPVDEASFIAAANELVGSDLSAYLRALVHTPEPKGLASGSYPLE